MPAHPDALEAAAEQLAGATANDWRSTEVRNCFGGLDATIIAVYLAATR
jgi:hypothetical protein